MDRKWCEENRGRYIVFLGGFIMAFQMRRMTSGKHGSFRFLMNAIMPYVLIPIISGCYILPQTIRKLLHASESLKSQKSV